MIAKVHAMLDSRFRPPLVSHKHTLHLCRVTPTTCRPDLHAPDVYWTVVIFGNPDSCYLQFFEALFTDSTHCNQEGPFPAQENMPCLHGMESLATNFSCRSNVSLVSCCQLLLLAIAVQLDPDQWALILPPQAFRELHTRSATTLVVCVWSMC